MIQVIKVLHILWGFAVVELTALSGQNLLGPPNYVKK
jgi:hypothetical protein